MANTIRCKFRCQSVRKFQSWNGKRMLYEAEFNVVMDGSEENEAFFEATPSGTLKVATYKEDHFPVGAEFYVDIVPIENAA
jgi:hypothetical protein